MSKPFRCQCALCLRSVQSTAGMVCPQCRSDAVAVNHVLAAAAQHVPGLQRAPGQVIASRMWLRLAPPSARPTAEELVKRYNASWQLELGSKPDPDWFP